MSQNFFAALDDSGDEAPAPAKSVAKKREPQKNDKKSDSSSPAGSKRPNSRNTKQGRGGRNPPRDGKRAYDRRSGTGRGKEIKKGGGGARNWGSDKADAKKMEGAINEDEVKEDKPTELQEDEAVKDAPVEEKPEDKTISFADYLASKGKKEEITIREVEDEFKGFSASRSVETDFLVMGGEKQKKNKKKKDSQKKTIEVGFRSARPNSGRGDRDRGDRGGRGRGGRDGRGRGGRDGRGRGRGGRGRNSGIDVQDETAFPSL